MALFHDCFSLQDRLAIFGVSRLVRCLLCAIKIYLGRIPQLKIKIAVRINTKRGINEHKTFNQRGVA